MGALGRILQVVGWLWMILAVVGTMFESFDLSILPGIILVVAARVVRNQAQRTEIPDLGRGTEAEEKPEPEAPERMMNTERRRQVPPAIPEPAHVELPAKEPPRPMKRNDLLEEIVAAGRQAESAETPLEPEQLVPLDDPESRRPMSSAEMIARAHERWDSKPR